MQKNGQNPINSVFGELFNEILFSKGRNDTKSNHDDDGNDSQRIVEISSFKKTRNF